VNRERGSAVVEFAVLGSLIFGVLIQTVVLFGGLHRATLATSAAAREYGRVVVLADSESDAARRGALVVEQTAVNHGMAADALHPSVSGRRARGELLRVTVRTEVPVVKVPFIGAVLPRVSIPVEATQAVQIDRYRSAP
jgi:Flp pilus assembly pilin Flp